jgi:hypothetical protein
MDHRQMRVIDAKYRVRMGYWALQNNMQEYNERFNGGLGKNSSGVKKKLCFALEETNLCIKHWNVNYQSLTKNPH